MDQNNRREKHVTDGGKGVQKRGSGLGSSGPVGRGDGYQGRGSQGSGPQRYGSSGNQGPRRDSGGGSGMNPKMMLIALLVVIIVVVAMRSGACSTGDESGYYETNTGGNSGYSGGNSGYSGGNSGYSGGNSGYSGGSSSGGSSSGYSGDLFGMLSGFTGSNGVSEGWSTSSSNTAVLNREVAPEARAKRTQIYGNGQDTVTIMVYMCGTDLESKSGMASKDLAEICSATLSDNVNIIVYTGGCRGWKTSGISSSVNQIYKVENGGLRRLVADDGSKVMTDPGTLASFIKFCAQNFPANRNDLIFWDHGGGSISGYGYDEKNPYSGSMSLSGINKALKSAGVQFDFIGFDTCLMGTLETGLMAANYADYMVASEETEPGVGWYYTNWLSSLAADPSQSTLDTGKNIVDGFVDTCARSCAGQKATLSLVDLAELEKTVPEKLSAFSEATGEMIRGDSYKQVSDARADCREFAVSSKIDQIDLVNFANNIGTPSAAALSDVLLNAIKYNRTSSNMTNAYGLSIYFPYQKASKVDSVTNIYKEIGMDEEYAQCIKSFAGMGTAGQISAGGSSSPLSSLFGDFYGSSGGASGSDAISSLLSAFLSGGRSVNGIDRAQTEYMDDADAFDVESVAEYIAVHQFNADALAWYESEDGQHLLALPDDQWDLIQTLQVNMFVDDGEGFVDLGLDTTWEFTEDGRLIGDTDDTWISIDKQPVAYYYESTIIENGSRTITGRVPAMLNGDRVELILVFDDANPYGYIAGARYVYTDGETETVAKSMTELEEGDVIDFLCDYYTYEGEYMDSYYLGDSWEYHADAEISNTYVGDGTSVTYLLTDLYGQEYWTPVVPKN